jgi:hypothetical protein
MKNNCVEREKIFALAQHMLSEGEQQEVSAHVETCEGCRGLLQNYRRLDSVLDEWSPAAEPSPWFDARLRAAVEAQAERRMGFFGRLSWKPWMATPALASLLLVVSLAVIRSGWMSHHSQPSTTSATVQSPPRAAKPEIVPVSEAQAANQELKMYQNLPVLEDYDMLANFDVISELPKGNHKIAD